MWSEKSVYLIYRNDCSLGLYTSFRYQEYYLSNGTRKGDHLFVKWGTSGTNRFNVYEREILTHFRPLLPCFIQPQHSKLSNGIVMGVDMLWGPLWYTSGVKSSTLGVWMNELRYMKRMNWCFVLRTSLHSFLQPNCVKSLSFSSHQDSDWYICHIHWFSGK